MYRIIVVTAACLLLSCIGNISSETDAPISEEDFYTIDGPTDDATTESTINEDNEEGEMVSRQKRTIYGYEVNDYDYPYVVSIRVDYRSHYCGGTILTPKLILTAAHCLDEYQISYVVVSNNYPKYYYKVAYYIKYPYYHHDKYIMANDIALLVLEQSIPNAQTVSLQPYPQNVTNEILAYALGWGDTENRFMSQNLRRVDVPFLHPSQCQSNKELNQRIVCIDTRKGNVCSGDSGGPLMYGNIQVGVTSYVTGPPSKYPWVKPRVFDMCMSGMPAFFTRISAYYTWIQGYVQKYR
ncbi:hypothetical protein QAD02_016901 [Eretmocerus hayati]|uniref:Uncharacterized protein n=1 Tax=Eretmocerus hayati TaxID=131215 RepID=A0ACC2PBW4_9HYME|nr:hypothetical protein QAD02_016901 [Eretmocerus hayati]